MVKIRELTNQELMEKIEKYISTYNKLENERQKRLEKFGEIDELLTQDEKEYYAKNKTRPKKEEAAPEEFKEMPKFKIQDEDQYVQSEKTNPAAFHIDFSEEELEKLQVICKEDKVSDAEKLQTITKILDLAKIDFNKD
jgi:hypothetical protein